jgi:hypothetical protein
MILIYARIISFEYILMFPFPLSSVQFYSLTNVWPKFKFKKIKYFILIVHGTTPNRIFMLVLVQPKNNKRVGICRDLSFRHIEVRIIKRKIWFRSLNFLVLSQIFYFFFFSFSFLVNTTNG